MAGWIRKPLGTEVNLDPGDVAFDGVASPLKGAQPSVFGPCLLWPKCQTAGWMNTPLGTDVDIGPGHIVLDGDPAPPAKGVHSPLFSAHVFCGHSRPSQLLLSSCSFFFRPAED